MDYQDSIDIRLYPNPTTEGVIVEVAASTPVRVRVFNMLGQVIFDNPILNQDFISTHNWHRGAYIVKIGNMNKKIVVE